MTRKFRYVVTYYPLESRFASMGASVGRRDYTGFVQTDGYAAYDCEARGNPGITYMGCFARAAEEIPCKFRK